MSKTIKTKNKYEVIFYMNHGITVQSVIFHKEGEKIIPEFEVTGETLNEVSSRYYTGRAIISLVELEVNSSKLEKLIEIEFERYLGGIQDGE